MLHLGRVVTRRTLSTSLATNELTAASTLSGCRCQDLRIISTRLQGCTKSFSSKSINSSPSSSSSLQPPQLDISAFLADAQQVKQNIINRRAPVDPAIVDDLVQLEREAQELRQQAQSLRARRNTVSTSSSAKGTLSDASLEEARRAEGKQVKAELQLIEPRLVQLERQILDLAAQLPNTSHPRSPVGPESLARIVRTHGPRISADSPLVESERDHLSLSNSSRLGWTDMPAAARMTGASWPLLTDEGALLELALTNYAMSVAVKHGFRPVMTPDVVRTDVVERCGFRPRDEGVAAQTYFLSTKAEEPDASGEGTRGASLCLAGTAEIPLVAMSAQRTFEGPDVLPRKHVALGRAFRAEAGARGADTRGLYRVHQFTKVEMVVVCAQEDSDRELEELRAVQEEILRPLGLSLRVLDMPTEELGASAYRKYDIEAWMPGRGKWGELSSASNCTDYQSRRLGIRYKPTLPPQSPGVSAMPADRLARPPLEDLDIPTPAALEATALYPSQTGYSPGSKGTSSGGIVGGNGIGGRKTLFAHTLNGTAAAIPRLIVALLENGVFFKKRDDQVERQAQSQSQSQPEQGSDALKVKRGKKGKGEASRALEIDRVRLPEVLKPFWLGGGDQGRVEIEWVKKGEPLRMKE